MEGTPLTMPTHAHNEVGLGTSIGRGVAAGLAGATVMTAFQKLVEMPITGRGDSYEPANVAMRLLPIGRKRGPAKRRLNYVVHFSLGATWGAAYSVVARQGLRGPRAVATAFAILWPGDVAATVALGLNPPPWRWSAQDLAIDVGNKVVLAGATGAVYDRLAGAAPAV